MCAIATVNLFFGALFANEFNKKKKNDYLNNLTTQVVGGCEVHAKKEIK